MQQVQYRTNGGRLSGFDVSNYPDGAPLIKHIETEGIDRLLIRTATLSGFMAALFWCDTIAWRAHQPMPHLLLPYVPCSRQDRLSYDGDVLFSLKSVAGAINARGFRSVTVLDPHSDVTPAVIDRCHVLHAADFIRPPPGKYAAVIAPDGGAEKRAARVAKKLGVPLFHAWKSRDMASGEISGFGTEPLAGVAGKLALVVDDICDGGGTFVGLAGELHKAGVKAHLWTTHGLYTAGTGRLLEHYGHIYCTDSVAGPRDGVIEIKACEELLV
jgi:ribose-phosphate pyrophosphokinase